MQFIRQVTRHSEFPKLRGYEKLNRSALNRRASNRVIIASHCKYNERLYSLAQAVNDLRANSLINAGYSDNGTGE